MRRIPSLVTLTLFFASSVATAQTIDFETTPSGPTSDGQPISTDYSAAPFGVSFETINSSGQAVGAPMIAKVGPPTTAFQGCPGGDMPLPGQGVGQSFLTTGLGGSNLRVIYASPVALASGQLIDVDIWSDGGIEEWTITARDAGGSILDSFVVTAPGGTSQCGGPHGEGNATTATWSVSSPTGAAQIDNITFESTGTASPNIAFDNFSTASSLIVPVCFGDGTGTACPCGNQGNAGEGCSNSTTTHGAVILGAGIPSISADSLQLSVSGVPGNKPCLVLQGSQLSQFGSGTPVGEGLLCVAGQTARSMVQITSAGAATLTEFQPGVSFGSASQGPATTTNYQFWYRDPAQTCNGGGFNFSNAVSVLWQP